MSIRVRFAPSPTGALHIGGIRTALFNYLLAKKHGGTFILRIEDTDQTRYVEGAEQYIIDALKWCGIAPTEGVGFGEGQYAPYRQSDRFKQGVYKKYADELIEKGLAYYAFDTPQQLEAMRNTLQAEGGKNQSYSHATRMRDDLNLQNSLRLSAEDVASRLAAGEPCVVRLKITENQLVTLTDIIRGEVTFNTNELDDKVLLKADGMPTYHLANIVDDYEMKISHVIRGEEWLPSAGHHVLIYRAFGWESVMPQFAHLPLILKPDGKGKLSKRDGAKFGFPVFPLEWNDADPTKSFAGFRSIGFDPRAVINFLVMLGWNPGTEQEIFSLDELAELFSLEKINKAGARFDYDKAKWFNKQYAMKEDDDKLVPVLRDKLVQFDEDSKKNPSIDKPSSHNFTDNYLSKVAHITKERVSFTKDIYREAEFLFKKQSEIGQNEKTIIQKKWKPNNRYKFDDLVTSLSFFENVPNLIASDIEHFVKEWANNNELKMGDIMPVFRIGLTGTMQGPGVFDIISILGITESTGRLTNAFDKFDTITLSSFYDMDIRKNIVDQRMRKIVSDYKDSWFSDIKDENQKLSRAFLMLAVQTYEDIELPEAYSILTDGGNDTGIDAVWIGNFKDYTFEVHLFQSKYVFDLNKDSNFPSNSIELMISAVNTIFDASLTLNWNKELYARVEEIRSFILNGNLPIVKCIMVNNGLSWQEEGMKRIENARFEEDQVQFEHFNHADIVGFLQNRRGIAKATINFVGENLTDNNFNLNRVIIGKMNVRDVAKLVKQHGDNLFEKNVRRYLGKNRINKEIEASLLNDQKRDNFYFYNNGITIICSKFAQNALQSKDRSVVVQDMQIINGGQTCKTIEETVNHHLDIDFSNTFVLVRLYELVSEGSDDIISDITIATNSQNPIEQRDLNSNNEEQRNLEIEINDLGFKYKRKRDGLSSNGETIPVSVVAEAVYAIWRKMPDQAKFKKRELFGKFYSEVFKNLNGAQAIIAVLIFRYCDNQRKKNLDAHSPYSNYVLAMIMGFQLIEKSNLSLSKLDNRAFPMVKSYFDTHKEQLYQDASKLLVDKLNILYPKGYDDVELRQLSAIFRRRDFVTQLGY